MTIITPNFIVVENLYVESFYKIGQYKDFINENKRINIVNIMKFEGQIVITFTRKEREYYGN